MRVNAIAPGFVLDAMAPTNIAESKQDSSQIATQVDSKDMNLLQRKVPLADLYSAIEFLAKNNSITGQTLQIDGGSNLQCPAYMLKN